MENMKFGRHVHSKQVEQARRVKIGKATTTHGMSKTNFYKVWENINTRLTCKTHKTYKHYGGRGIKCEWKRFEDFYRDMYGSYLIHLKQYGKRDTTIDRINVNGNYSKSNCKWATRSEQNRNQRPRTLCLSEAQREDIRSKYKRGGITQLELAKAYGVDDSVICLVINKKKAYAV